MAVCLAVLGLAAEASSPALAESSVPVAPMIALPSAEVATALLADTGWAQVEPVSAVVPPPAPLPAVSVTTTAERPATDGADAAEPPPEAVAQMPVEPKPDEIVAPDPPVVPDMPDMPDAPDVRNPVIEQSGATNVNVSVRVDSPGDNGSVAQANVVGGTGAGVGAAPQYQPDAPQYQAPISDAEDSEAASLPATSAPPAETAASDGSWNWTWNCTDMPEIPIAAMQPRSWNWNWNCDGDETTNGNSKTELRTQYQPAVAQYRPVNINISIRINSPGNDGPVIQTNVAVAVTAPAPVQVVGGSAGPLLPGPPAAEVTVAVQNGLPGAEAFASSPGQPETPLLDAEQASETDDCCLLPEARGTLTAAPDAQSVARRLTTTTRQRDIRRAAQLGAWVAATARLSTASVAVAAAAMRPSGDPAGTEPPAPRRLPVDLTHEPVLALGAVELVPLSATDGRTGYATLVFLAIGFAFAAASRAIAIEVRATAVETGSPPDRPG